jgi:hypothetical protein
MRLFPVPYSITEEEKLFGGYLSLRQVVYLAVFIIAAAMMIFCGLFPLALRLFLSLLLAGAGASLAFIKISNTGLDRYLVFAARYCVYQKQYCFKKQHCQ